MDKAIRAVTLWLWGGAVYYIMELIGRGHSHPSMFIVGGLCFLLIGAINDHIPWSMGLLWQSLIGAGIVTVMEFASGCIVNLWLGLGVWDYSDMPLNVLGQVCLPYTLLWIPLAAVGILLDDYLRWRLFGEERPMYALL